MSANVYNAVTTVLGIGTLVALAIAIFSLAAMIFRWNGPQRKRHVIRLLLSIVAIPCFIGIQQAILWLIFLPAFGREQMAQVNANRESRAAEFSHIKVGDQAPEFSVTDADGNTLSTSDWKGKVVLVNFFATWCGPCKTELPHLESIWQAHRGNKGFQLLVIGREESMESVTAFRAENGFSFPIAPDAQRDVYGRFATQGIPRTLLVSPDGTIVYSKLGFYEHDLDELRAVLSAQLAGLPLRTD